MMAPPGFKLSQCQLSFSVGIETPRPVVVETSPLSGPTEGGTDVRLVVTGLYVRDGDAVPVVTFGSTSAEYVSVVISDMDATILMARSPPVAETGLVSVFVNGKANTTFAYISNGVKAVCSSALCEVDAINGGKLTVRVSGFGVVRANTLTCSIDGQPVAVGAVSPAGPGSYDVAMTVPGSVKQVREPLTKSFISVSAGETSVYADMYYRSPPLVESAAFSADGSRISIVFDQRTNGTGSAINCTDVVHTEDESESAALGTKPVCSWDAQGLTLDIMLGNRAFIDVGDRVYVRDKVVKSLNGVSSPNVRQYANVSVPIIVIPPV
jgi:hypothetical protein